MRKRIISLVLVVIMAFSLCVPAAAARTENVEINYRAIKLVLNGEAIVPCDAAGKTVEPFIMRSSGTTYLPLRAVAQALGLDVQWDGATNTVTLTSGGEVKVGAGPAGTTTGKQKVDITYRDIKVFLNGEELNLVNVNGDKVEPFILKSNSSVYLPLRVVGEALGLQVGWDSASSTVSLQGSADESGVKSLKLNATEVNLGYNGSYQLVASFNEGAKDTSLTWSSSDENIATVDQNGYVKVGATEGSATITAKAVNGKTAKCTVTVKDETGVTSIGFPVENVLLAPGQTAQQVAQLNEGAVDKNVIWLTSNGNIARIDNVSIMETGSTCQIIAGSEEGEAVITAIAANGLSAQFTVRVSANVILYKPDGMVKEVPTTEWTQHTGWDIEYSGLNVENSGSKDDYNWSYGESYLYIGGSGETPYYGSAGYSSYFSKIESLYIKRGIDTVRSFSFDKCTNLKHAEIPNTVTRLDSYCFDDCVLERIGIPASVTEIVNTAFDTHKKPASSSNKNMVVYCESGSYAQSWAISNGLSYVEASMLHSADGRTIMVSTAERDLYLRSGVWFTQPVVTVYAADGTEKQILEGELDAYLANGWFKDKSEIMATVYSPDGSEKQVLKIEADKLEGEGWYAYPVCYVYAADGTKKVIPKSEVDSYVADGWYKDKSELYVTMYDIDGNTKDVLKTNVKKEQAAGWYLYEDYQRALAEKYSYMAGNDFRRVRRQYSQAVANGAYVVTYTNLDGDFCVLTYVSYKIISNYSVTTLHNVTKGTYVEDPADYYNKVADRYYGASKIKYLNLAIEAEKAQITAMQGLSDVLKTGVNTGKGAYVSSRTLNL